MLFRLVRFLESIVIFFLYRWVFLVELERFFIILVIWVWNFFVVFRWEEELFNWSLYMLLRVVRFLDIFCICLLKDLFFVVEEVILEIEIDVCLYVLERDWILLEVDWREDMYEFVVVVVEDIDFSCVVLLFNVCILLFKCFSNVLLIFVFFNILFNWLVRLFLLCLFLLLVVGNVLWLRLLLCFNVSLG